MSALRCATDKYVDTVGGLTTVGIINVLPIESNLDIVTIKLLKII